MIYWDNNKNLELIIKRGISFEEIEKIIMEEKYIDILKHPKRKNQYIFTIMINDYVWVVPFVKSDEKIFLKTAFPSRKFTNSYKRK